MNFVVLFQYPELLAQYAILCQLRLSLILAIPTANMDELMNEPEIADKQRQDKYEQLAQVIARYATGADDGRTAINGLYLSKVDSIVRPVYLAQWPCYALVIQGEKSVTLGQDVFQYGVGDYLIVSLDLPVISRVTMASKQAPNLAIGLELNPRRLDELISRIRLPDRILTMKEIKGIGVNRASVELLDATLRLVTLLDHPEDIDVMAPLIEQEILYYILRGPYGGQLLRFARENSSSNKIAKAIGWLQEHYRDTLKINVLAGFVGMSESSLHEHFKSVTSMTPIQYQKQLRLHTARKLMLVERLDAREAAFQVGYQSPAQFSREYARLYGNSPLRDVNELRKQHA